MDFADVGEAVTEQITSAAIANIRANAKIVTFPLIGRCYSCEVELLDRPFCDKDCRLDYENNR